jgi:hypothetical protein
MPFGDGTGPAGLGPMSGRALGFCRGYGTPGYTNPLPGQRYGPPVAPPYAYGPYPGYPPGGGMAPGRGRSMGGGFGMGRGLGLGWRRGFGRRGRGRPRRGRGRFAYW